MYGVPGIAPQKGQGVTWGEARGQKAMKNEKHNTSTNHLSILKQKSKLEKIRWRAPDDHDLVTNVFDVHVFSACML
jgi:hypothetical protein